MVRTTSSGLGPSRRALANIRRNLMMDLSREVERYTPYDQDHPQGLLDITSSINTLMRNEMSSFVSKLPRDKTQEYGSVAGSLALTRAVAALVNDHFAPTEPVDSACIMGTNGVTALLDIVSFAACDAGEAIMYTTPAYGMFHPDLTSRNGIRVVEVPCEEDFDQFTADNSDALIKRLEAAYQRASKAGITVRAMLLCNPCNPLGRCYSRTTLAKLAAFCGRHQLHLISDEIYALSVTPAESMLDGFTSVLSLDRETGLDPRGVHVLYGASKDWGLGGLRLGFLITRSAVFKEACRRLGMFTWISSYSDVVFSAVASDCSFVTKYLKTYRQKLRESRETATQFLDRHRIPYRPANAGVFLWIELSKWTPLIDGCGTSEESNEVRLTKYLIKEGVYLEPGEAFFSPTPGKFRLVYSMDTETLCVGLNRLIDALKKLEKSKGTGDGDLSDEDEAELKGKGPPPENLRSRRLEQFLCFR
ncbi:Aspartate aminotransferase [Pleurostoma richardsiae]|uniref:Aspartate aminotransferase n=1 Tax=Pleurostoma richardsiae TaxID=41990 RepID=A0AA38RPP2_9PEZI|nr:Aspartate aminotransferase [Pleurostoma richardsiae]